MQSQIYFDNHLVSIQTQIETVSNLKTEIAQKYGLPLNDLFVTINGKIVKDNFNLESNVIRVSTKLVGGKGGFGSMLRAIGAQIEKTTNREACRDLSGRRLRDINEEKRLRKWLEGQEDREKEAAERKQKKIEKLLAEPKIEVKLGSDYEKGRQDLPERVGAAVDAGWLAAGSSKETGNKRKLLTENKHKEKKKAKLWIDADLSDCSLSDDEEEIQGEPASKSIRSTDSGNDSDHLVEVCQKV